MFSSGPNYTKLKTNLRLAVNRTKLLEKKKAELAQKARKEIGDYLATGKVERARIRVEHIIREDFLVEAMEIVEMYCDLLLARFGLITQMKELDDGIAEPIYSLVWVCPRLQADIAELRVVADIFIKKYGPEFAERARTATGEHHVSEKLMHKLQLQAPPKLLVEKYLIEIAKNYNIEYEPDPQVMQNDIHSEGQSDQAYLIDLSDRNNLGGGGGAAGGAPPQIGFINYPQVPPLPNMPEPPSTKPFNYPPPFGGSGGGGSAATPSGGAAGGFSYNIPPNIPPQQPAQPPTANAEKKDLNTQFINQETSTQNQQAAEDETGSPDENILNGNKPKPQPRSKMPQGPGAAAPSAPPPNDNIPYLPNVPNDLPDIPMDNSKPDNDDEINFDDLSRRFENLKKRK